MAIVQKIDSNVTGLRAAKEDSIGVLPATPDWKPLEPNTYDAFGGEISTVARNPINQGRQRQKGVVTDLDASGGINTDLTFDNLLETELIEGFFFATRRAKGDSDFSEVPVIDVDGTAEEYTLSNRELQSVAVNAGGAGYVVGDVVTIDNTGATNTTAVSLTVAAVSAGAITDLTITEPGRYSVDPTTVVANSLSGGSGAGGTVDLTFGVVITFRVNDLLLAENFGDSENNGVKTVTAVDGTGVTITVSEDLVDDASPASDASVKIVGHQFAAGDLDVDASGTLPVLTTVTKDLTELGIIPGEFFFIGGDTAATQFDNAENNGFARAFSITANALTIDKSQQTMVTEANAADTIQLFTGSVVKNEADPTLQIRRTFQLERTLGAPDDAAPADIQAEYLVGSVTNELTFNFNTADKITADLSFVAIDSEQRTATQGVKAGNRPSLVSGDAFNTSSDFSRLKLAILDPDDSNPTALFAFLTEFTLTINNNASPNKAVSKLGAFEVTVGQFNVEGSVTAYFSQVEAVQAVRNNADVTLDFSIVRGTSGNKQGISVDVPLIALGDGRPNVEQDQPILIPLETPAAADRNFNHTLLFVFFCFLPDAADQTVC